MKDSYYIFSTGNLTQKDNTIRFTAVDGTVKDLPIENVNEIYLMSETNVTTKLLGQIGRASCRERA